MTRIVVLPADETACGYYRMMAPAQKVARSRPDWTVEMYRPGDVKLGQNAFNVLTAIHGLPDPLGIDLLVMQRTGTSLQYQLLEWARNHGIATVVDSDDALHAIHPDNTSHAAWNGKGPADWRWLNKAVGAADVTTCTTDALARYYTSKGARVETLPNFVPADEIPSREEAAAIRQTFDPTLTIGWAGFTATHPGDLEVLGGAVRQVVADTGCKVRVIGDGPGAMKAWGLDNIDQVGPVPLGPDYYRALASLDVALVPLQDSPFNKAKSWLKALEFSALGIPVVASPTPANRELGDHVPVLFATTEAEWYDAIRSQLVRTAAVGGWDATAEHVTANLSYRSNVQMWIRAWERALTRRARLAL